ncbi:MAG TPA: hypothetical protein VFW29_05285 [Solirubrobacteraceae bacterium]|nr:hypothetical protein [Solirubrobacteraceae bacterium]
MLALLACAAVAALAPGSALAAEGSFEGEVLGCKYLLEAESETEGGTFRGEISECAGELDPSAQIEGNWKSAKGDTSTGFELAEATISVFEVEETLQLGYTFSVPLNLTELIEKYEEIEQLKEEGKATKKQLEEAANVEAQVRKAVQAFEEHLVLVAAEQIGNQAGSGIPSLLEHVNSMTEQLNAPCVEHGTNGLDPFCSPYLKTTKSPSPECPVRQGTGNEGGLDEGAGEDAEGSDTDQAALCPVFNTVQEEAVFVCVPSFVTGELDTGDKPLVIMGGGALVMVPDEHGKAKIKSSKAVVELGGAIAGYNLAIEAPDIAMAGGFQNTIGELELAGDRVSVGRVDGETLLSSVPKLPEDWHGEIVEPALLHTKITLPDRLNARRTIVKATESFLVASGSVVTGAGMGSLGANFETGENPTGESENFGGSHGGLGGYGRISLGTQAYGRWYTMEGRSPVSDDPFHPTGTGDGGGGEPGGALGLSGGGIVQVESPGADVTVDGEIDVSGFGTGLQDSTANGDHGGSGAGGSVYVTAETLAGAGVVDADGGGHCDERTHITECVNGGGGSGGGGRIAALFEEDPAWTGTLEAHGGVDKEFLGEDGEEYLGSGGAGTVFTRSVAFKENGEVREGTGAFSDGTLIVDGGRAAGAYPPPDGTPVSDSWSSPHRKLVVTGEARAYGRSLEYGAIELIDGAVLTTGIGKEGTSIPTTLKVKSNAISVDATSRISMTGRGYAGGSSETVDGAGETASGQTASTDGHGGSHGGVGGRTGAHENPGPVSGSTYDSPEAPALPGGGGAGVPGTAEGNAGGGVLDVEAGTLALDGAISADGAAGDGPTATEPAPYDFEGGGGAGGSVLVHAATIGGSGTITALGGNTCIATTPPLVLHTAGCNAPVGSSGGGGGGRVALIAGAACSWTGSLSAANGVDSQAEIAGELEDAEAMRGGTGSVFFPAPAAGCPTGPPPEEHHESPATKTGGGTPPPAPPSNVFTILSHKVKGRTGVVTVVVSIPDAGTLAGVESAVLKKPRKHHAAKLEKVGSAHGSATAPGRVTLKFRLSRAAKAYLRSHHRVSVTIRITFTPTGGTAAARSLTLTIVKPRR